MTRILVVEDEPGIALGLEDDLRLEGWDVEVAPDGVLGAKRAREQQFDLILLDVMLPGKDGFDVCRELRRAGLRTPIIMLTAKAQEAEKILGLDIGADDYVTKPFSLKELGARVRAVLRRKAAGRVPPMSLYRGRHLVADFEAVAVTVDGESVRLTRREFELLRCLVEHRNRVLSRDRLLERVWGYEQIIETRSVDVHVGRLRSKLGAAGAQIETVVGLGYRFIE